MPPKSAYQADPQMNAFFLDLANIWKKHDRMIDMRQQKRKWQSKDDAEILVGDKTIYAEAYARVKREAEDQGGLHTLDRLSNRIAQANALHARNFTSIESERTRLARLAAASRSEEAAQELQEALRQEAEIVRIRQEALRQEALQQEGLRQEALCQAAVIHNQAQAPAAARWHIPSPGRGPPRPTHALRQAPREAAYRGKGKGRAS